MQLKQETVTRLGKIVKEEYHVDLNSTDLDQLAHGLVRYFDVLFKINHRSKKNGKSRSSNPSPASISASSVLVTGVDEVLDWDEKFTLSEVEGNPCSAALNSSIY
ncbi:MAG: hypothetical protein UU23_C0001G0026 [Candidatus Curtissbacteria bacterium GW2011_GWA1_40_9]|uniref:Uncharacterized protein n=1 Tax=Candidatus Curtissbacteria bacterium GW2011_GWA1_40_9 TaxID=1618408 RepID=A0A0G0WS96_9BACT|nr:MAG: hypothetical protein UU23_C0001G0026 [Candidatus Curtissbacteria bacterium GW2011_GWA1_40_9]